VANQYIKTNKNEKFRVTYSRGNKFPHDINGSDMRI